MFDRRETTLACVLKVSGFPEVLCGILASRKMVVRLPTSHLYQITIVMFRKKTTFTGMVEPDTSQARTP